MSVTSETASQRLVPGAPPLALLSKSQRKKRRAQGKSENEPDTPITGDATSAAVLEKAPEPSEVREGSLAPELISRSASVLPEEDVLLKPSPIVDLVTKRLKATTKKIGRITPYASTDPEKLNDDQKRSVKQLPTLEAIQKELGEVKKAIEVHEQEISQEIASRRLEAEKADKARVADAVIAAETALVQKTNEVFELLRLRSSLNTGASDISSLADSAEISTLYSVADILLSEDAEQRHSTLNGLLRGIGSHGTVSYPRLLIITQQALSAPRAPTPLQDEPQETEVEPIASSTLEAEPVISGVPATSSGGLKFMQDSEIDSTPFEEGAEWIEKADAIENEEEPDNGHVPEPAAPAEAGPLDWAAEDEHGLPPIAGLHAEFGTSGSATPAEQDVTPEAAHETANGHADSHGNPHGEVDDGFVTPGGRARGGRGRGGHRGGERGHGHRGEFRGFRGESRGGFRGEHGGFRGEHGGFRGEHGGFRGDRGGYRGAFRGEGGNRGGERGAFRGARGGGDWRGDGERGRGGRGRGRGDRGGPGGHHHQQPRPATPSTPA
ncbi:hypothetical protein CPB83DRAFT_857672 [Crepidotus variabilis]|uniref:Uncharacterized protein n=1 Tax=Crepidotus variabilis TaxID=179855 RepID=A0A9P6ECY5_9AGAR|nr:hypothetical protein CPB83DRAFT_857672 [Crepidotus variabilis]